MKLIQLIIKLIVEINMSVVVIFSRSLLIFLLKFIKYLTKFFKVVCLHTETLNNVIDIRIRLNYLLINLMVES